MDVKMLLGKAANILTAPLPRKNIIIFESSPDYSDNTYWFFKYLAENTDVVDRYKCVWILHDKSKIKEELCGKKIDYILKNADSPKESLRYIWYICNAKFIVDCNSFVYKRHKNQTRVFLQHGMPLKVVDSYSKSQGETDINAILSHVFDDFYVSEGQEKKSLLHFGSPRNDILAENNGKRKNRKTTNIIWMPTYRQHANVTEKRMDFSFPLGIPIIKSKEELKDVNNFLALNDIVLYLRPHPAQDISMLNLENLSNFKLCNDEFLTGRQLYDFLTETDALITDYSSIYYDYLLLDRPIALATEDKDEFLKKWQLLYENMEENYRCHYLVTVDDLKKFALDVKNDNDIHENERHEEITRFHDFTDGRSSEQLYKFLKENYNL